jgi:hypothetical protein
MCPPERLFSTTTPTNDYAERGGVMLPITVDNIINLPFDLVTAMTEAVFAKLFPAPTTAANSLAGSARRANTKLKAVEATNSESDTDSAELAVSGESLPTN